MSNAYRSTEAKWRAVVARDRTAAARFVFAVVTTGVFCRPGCAARRPRRDNVRFFTTPAAARRQGFRPCRRCEPESRAPSRPDRLVAAAVAQIERRLDENPTLAELAAAVGASPFHLQRLVKARTGLTPKQLATSLRLRRFRDTAKRGRGVASAGYEAGFGSNRGLYAAARAGLGMTPGRYARGGKGLDVAYSIERCALGHVLVASTEEGVCAVLLGANAAALVAALRGEFPAAKLVRAPSQGRRREWTDAVLSHLDGARAPLLVPLDLDASGATPFQRRVWTELRRIAPGETRTYAQVAAALGDPDASRAVARACARNVLAVLIPCHRVIRSDGAHGGYKWGARKKTALLVREARA